MRINGQLEGAIAERFTVGTRPAGTAAQEGRFIYLTDLKRLQMCIDSAWVTLPGYLSELLDAEISGPAANQVLLYNGLKWINSAISSNLGNGVYFFLDDTISDVGGIYNQLLTYPTGGDEIDDFIDLVASESPKAIENYITYPTTGLGITSINAGAWNFNIWAKVNSVASSNCTVQVDVYKRTSGGSETKLFTVNTPNLTTTVTLYRVESVQQAFAVNATDRLVLKFSVTNDSASSRIVHFYHNGTTHYSYIKTPLVQNHQDLNNLQGGSATERYHLTAAQAAAVAGNKTITTITSSRAITTAEFKGGIILLDGTSNEVAVSLPTVADVNGYECIIKCINSSNACSISTNVDGEAYYFAGKNDRVDIFSDGSLYYK